MYRARFNKSSSKNTRRWQIGAVAGVAVAMVGVGLGVASADETVPTVNCPTLTNLPGVPAQAQDEVQRNLELLNTQISEANNRLRTSVGQGGPAFIQNAILGPLADKRFATINRIETAIGRNAAKPDLNAEGLKTCSLNEDGGNSAEQPVDVPPPGNGGGNNGGGNNAGGGDNGGGGDNAGTPTVNCPTLNNLPAVPAQAAAEVQRNLELLNTQIAEANARIVSTVGQGGPAFIQNAILGPLQSKRFATINRIETAIGRNAAKPDLNAEGLSVCSLNQNGGASAEQPVEVPAGNAGGNAGNGGNGNGGATGALPTVNCPALNNLPTIPAQAAAEVQRNLELLNTQIAEANARIVSTVGQGGPAFIQNAILGPLEGKRFATINRIETAIGRNAVKPNLNAEGLAPCSLNQ